MKDTYIINKETLENIASAIRTKENSTDKIVTVDFSDRILNLDAPLTTEEYMRLSDLIQDNPLRDEANYKQSDIKEVERMIDYLEEIVRSDTNGE